MAKDTDTSGIACRRHVHIACVASNSDYSRAKQKLIAIFVNNFPALTKDTDSGKYVGRPRLQVRDTADTVYAFATCTSARQTFAAAAQAEDTRALAWSTKRQYTDRIPASVG